MVASSKTTTKILFLPIPCYLEPVSLGQYKLIYRILARKHEFLRYGLIEIYEGFELVNLRVKFTNTLNNKHSFK